MAGDSVLFVGWNRPIHGKEKQAIELFGTSMAYYSKQVEAGNIESFEPIILNAHGGDMNGFVLLRGKGDKLDALARSDEFQELIVRGQLLIEGLGVVQGFAGEGVQKQIQRVAKLI